MKNNIKKLALILFFFNNSFKVFSGRQKNNFNNFKYKKMVQKTKRSQRKLHNLLKKYKQQISLAVIMIGLLAFFFKKKYQQQNKENLDKKNNAAGNAAPKNPVNLQQNVPLNFNIKIFSEQEIRELYNTANKCKFTQEITDFFFKNCINKNKLIIAKYHGNMNHFDHIGSFYLDKFIVDNKNLLSDKYKNNNYMLNYINYYVSTYDVNNNFDIAFSNQLNVIKLLIDDIKKDENDSNNFVTDFKKTIVLNGFKGQLNLFTSNITAFNNNNKDVYINYLNEDYKEDLYQYIESLKLSDETVNSFIEKKTDKLSLKMNASIFQNFKNSPIYEKMNQIFKNKNIQNFEIYKDLSRFLNLHIREQTNIILQFNTLLNHRNCQEQHYKQLFDLFTKSKLDNVKEILLKHKEFFSPIIKNNGTAAENNNQLIFQTILIELIKKLKEKQNLKLLKPLIESIIINFINSEKIINFSKNDIKNLSLEDMKLIGISDDILNHFKLFHEYNYFQNYTIDNKASSDANVEEFFTHLHSNITDNILQDSINRILTYLTESSSHIREETFIKILDGDLKKDIETLVQNFQSNNVEEITNLLENIIINIRNSIINVKLINNKKQKLLNNTKQNDKYQQILINKNDVLNKGYVLNKDINDLIDLLIEHNTILDKRLDNDILEKNLKQQIETSFLKINNKAVNEEKIMLDILNQCLQNKIIIKDQFDTIINQINNQRPSGFSQNKSKYDPSSFKIYLLDKLSVDQLRLFKEKVNITSDNITHIIYQNTFNEYYNEKQPKKEDVQNQKNQNNYQFEEILTTFVYKKLINEQENHQ